VVVISRLRVRCFSPINPPQAEHCPGRRHAVGELCCFAVAASVIDARDDDGANKT
jgi:hypothetical protein